MDKSGNKGEPKKERTSRVSKGKENTDENKDGLTSENEQGTAFVGDQENGLFHLLSVQGCGRRIPRGFTFKSAGSFQGGKDATTLKFPRGRKGLYLCIAKIFQGG